MSAALRCCLFLASAVAVCSTAQAGKFNRHLDVGDRAPRWEGLTAIDGRTRSFDDYRDAEILVVVFTRDQCPVATAYEGRIRELADEFRDRGVVLVAINSVRHPAESLEKLRERAERRGFKFDYLADPTQQAARDYGATATPQFFVLDRDRTVAYMGAFDDNARPERVEHRYLHDAVVAVLEGRPPEVTETRPVGCRLEFE